jgi:hypothetical protein
MTHAVWFSQPRWRKWKACESCLTTNFYSTSPVFFFLTHATIDLCKFHPGSV